MTFNEIIDVFSNSGLGLEIETKTCEFTNKEITTITSPQSSFRIQPSTFGVVVNTGLFVFVADNPIVEFNEKSKAFSFYSTYENMSLGCTSKQFIGNMYF